MSYTRQLADWRERVVLIGGGFAHMTLVGLADDTTDPAGFVVEINEVLWDAPSGLDRELDRVTLLGDARVEPSMLEFPNRVVSLVSNDGVAWNMGAVDGDGCVSPLAGIAERLGLTPVLAQLTNSWDGFLQWPRGSVCDDIVIPPQPQRDDHVIAEFLSRIGDIDAEADRLAHIDQLADRLAVQNHASVNDIKRQLLAGVAEQDLEFRPLGQLILRIPSLPEQEAMTLRVFFEGDPLEFLAWGTAERRTSVEFLLPRLGNTVYVYVGTFDELPDAFGCPAEYTDLEPYAIIPADVFHAPNNRVNLDNWRP